MTDSSPPLVYVFIGDSLPAYVTPSLRLTRRFFRGQMVLLTNARNKPMVKGVIVEDFTTWYRAEPFFGFVQRTPLDPTFRGGFWLAAAERFFVLNQYMSRKGVQKFFHAELDNLVFNLKDVAEDLDRQGRGIFFPTDADGRGFGSLVYCNDRQSLDELTVFMAENSHLGNEMTILGHYAIAHPSMAYVLPSSTSLSNHQPENLAEGLFDAAAIGQWLFGIDPANTVYTTFNKDRNAVSSEGFQGVRFSFSPRKGLLFGRSPKGTSFRVHNLHVHSKIFSRLVIPGVLSFYLLMHRIPGRMPVVIAPGHVRRRFLEFLLNRSQQGVVRAFCLSGSGQRLLQFLVASSRVPLSNRQLEAFHSLLPVVTAGDKQESDFGAVRFQLIRGEGPEVLSVSFWREGHRIEVDNPLDKSKPDETRELKTPRAALEYLWSLDIGCLVVLENEQFLDQDIRAISGYRNLLRPDRRKPYWEPPFELPTFPTRSRAITFTTTPQMIELSRLREKLDAEEVAIRWPGEVRLDTFVESFLNLYGQTLLTSGNSVTLATRGN